MFNRFNIPLSRYQNELSKNLILRIKALRAHQEDFGKIWAEYQQVYQSGAASYFVHTHLLEQATYAKQFEAARSIYSNILTVLTQYQWQDTFPFKNMLITASNAKEVDCFIEVAKEAWPYISQCTQPDKNKLYAVMASNAEKLLKLNLPDQLKSELRDIKEYADYEYNLGTTPPAVTKAKDSTTATPISPTETAVTHKPLTSVTATTPSIDVKAIPDSSYTPFSFFANSPIAKMFQPYQQLSVAAPLSSLAKPFKN